MKNANTGLWISAMIVCLGLAFACKEQPGPDPDPTPVPVPTEQPTVVDGSEAVCARAYQIGGSSTTYYECRDAIGDKVACPDNPEALEKCAE